MVQPVGSVKSLLIDDQSQDATAKLKATNPPQLEVKTFYSHRTAKRPSRYLSAV
jgi:hypothetical protein